MWTCVQGVCTWVRDSPGVVPDWSCAASLFDSPCGRVSSGGWALAVAAALLNGSFAALFKARRVQQAQVRKERRGGRCAGGAGIFGWRHSLPAQGASSLAGGLRPLDKGRLVAPHQPRPCTPRRRRRPRGGTAPPHAARPTTAGAPHPSPAAGRHVPGARARVCGVGEPRACAVLPPARVAGRFQGECGRGPRGGAGGERSGRVGGV